jgi:hypothetical protein
LRFIRIPGPLTAPSSAGNESSQHTSGTSTELLTRWPPARWRGVSSKTLSWLAPLPASSRHQAGEDAARHGAAGRGGEDPETTEPRA